ncbi:MAG: DUF1616 domain-containing protein [Deinococcota bacterium]
MRRFYRESFDLITALGLAVVFAILVLSFPDWQSLLRVGLGAVVMLLVPGYLMTVALFPQRDALHLAERVALTLGLSAVSIIVTGVVLNYLPVGIRPTSIAIGIASASAGFAALGGLRRSQLAVDLRFHLPRSVGARRLLLGLVGFIGLIYVFDIAIPEDRFTEFYLLSATGELDNYPRIVQPGQTFELRVGITNLEGQPQNYLLRTPLSSDETITVPRLANGERWELPVTLQAPMTTGANELVFELLKGDDLVVYRQVAFTISVRGEQQALASNLRQDAATPTAETLSAEALEQAATTTLAWLEQLAVSTQPAYLPGLFVIPPDLPAQPEPTLEPTSEPLLEPQTGARDVAANSTGTNTSDTRDEPAPAVQVIAR